jgi:manganese transport protein
MVDRMTLLQDQTGRAPSDLERIRGTGPVRGRLAMLGPAFVAAVAYIDPGNFATNIAGGAKYGFLLVWVIVAANLMAMLVQYLSAKVGIATGANLPELCRRHFRRPVTWGLWVQAELIAIATDLAEFVGAAIALNLLFGVPPFAAGLITAVIAFGILELQQRGYRRFELAIAAFLGIVCLGFLYDLTQVSVDTSALLGGFVPGFDGTDSVMLAVGILGATVMPHVVYLHSALTQGRIVARDDAERRSLLRFQRVDVVIAMGLAGAINLTMLVVAASLFHAEGVTSVDSIEGAHAGLERLLGGGAALAFAVALLASGLSSSSVGTYAGQVVMQGFIDRRIPLFLRRLVTMAPALVVLAVGVDATDALVASQVVLSFGIPFALVPMILLTRRADVMGALVNRRGTTAVAAVVAGLIIALNGFLLQQTFFGGVRPAALRRGAGRVGDRHEPLGSSSTRCSAGRRRRAGRRARGHGPALERRPRGEGPLAEGPPAGRRRLRPGGVRVPLRRLLPRVGRRSPPRVLAGGGARRPARARRPLPGVRHPAAGFAGEPRGGLRRPGSATSSHLSASAAGWSAGPAPTVASRRRSKDRKRSRTRHTTARA